MPSRWTFARGFWRRWRRGIFPLSPANGDSASRRYGWEFASGCLFPVDLIVLDEAELPPGLLVLSFFVGLGQQFDGLEHFEELDVVLLFQGRQFGGEFLV